ncbi:MAG TPA: PAS domain-containing sensor histidine kinase [Acetobacteraceae bacterium]|nr:PAS domain-containing sensor histidine kinase [Acetobacteraceae bacterium]
MNASSKKEHLRPASAPRPSIVRRVLDALLGKVITLVLAAIALALGVATFVLLSGGVRMQLTPSALFGLVLANLVVLLLLGAVLAGRITRVWVERRRGSAGSRLHVRLVMLFSVVAVTPTILVAVFATAFFTLGIQSWFNDRVRTALNEGLEASRGYLEEHRNNIRADALGMANDLSRAAMLVNDPFTFAQVLQTQTVLRGLTEATIFEPVTGQIIAGVGAMDGLGVEPAPASAIETAKAGEVAVLGSPDDNRVRAVVQLNSQPTLMLLIGRPVDQEILNHMARTEHALAEYNRLDQNRSGLQITFALIFALVALLVLSAAVLIGLVIANQIARPIGGLILAAERVRGGDLGVRVPEIQSEDEVAGLSRAFNRMTGQLASQRAELMDAYSQIDERRRFTETVLAGVSAGVIGVDLAGRIELPNRAASELLGKDLMAAIGARLADLVPAFAPLLEAVEQHPERALTAEVEIGPPSRRRTLLVRIGTELRGGRPDGYVVTFDDITELQSAQRKAAWADVARRIAHEIKNPLTPIQLSAERLKKRFAKEITSDPDTFAQCAETIVRHVGDIGRMVDEFSAFARMPQPVLRPEDVGRIAREALVLQRSARPEIEWSTDIPERGPMGMCDRRLLGQALTNLLQNAADAVAMRARAAGEPAGRIAVVVRERDGMAVIEVRDDGVGLPDGDRARLAEPYVTHKPKGTGLGLAIVKKIMEDHGGTLELDDRADGPGAVARLALPLIVPDPVPA